jgi:hypothetical protein
MLSSRIVMHTYHRACSTTMEEAIVAEPLTLRVTIVCHFRGHDPLGARWQISLGLPAQP